MKTAHSRSFIQLAVHREKRSMSRFDPASLYQNCRFAVQDLQRSPSNDPMLTISYDVIVHLMPYRFGERSVLTAWFGATNLVHKIDRLCSPCIKRTRQGDKTAVN